MSTWIALSLGGLGEKGKEAAAFADAVGEVMKRIGDGSRDGERLALAGQPQRPHHLLTRDDRPLNACSFAGIVEAVQKRNAFW
jgi:hypothetical protein